MILNSFNDIINFYHNVKIIQGTVVDNSDPLQKSRVRVSIPGMTDKIKRDHLPWYPLNLGVHNSGSNIPPIGTRVNVYFIDIYNSIVLGSIVSITAK